MKKILVINGHPVAGSLGEALADTYTKGALSGGYLVETINVRELEFNPNLMFGYSRRMQMEPDLENAIVKVLEADHLVWIFPIWWHGLPALLKGFIDRIFLPGIAYSSGKGKLPQKLLKGKTSRIIVTCDTPKWYNILILKNPTLNQLKRGTFHYVGIKPVKVTYINPIKNSTNHFRNKWLNKVEALGNQGK